MLPEIQSLINGAQRGKMQLAGQMPSAQNVGGAPSNQFDPAAAKWDMAFKSISSLAATLHEQRRELVANKVAKLAVQLQHLSLEQRKQIAENSAGTSPESNPGMAATQGMHAQGVPA